MALASPDWGRVLGHVPRTGRRQSHRRKARPAFLASAVPARKRASALGQGAGHRHPALFLP
ncbi:hypothetical protein [Kamptonema formosum]|uniref:hypothetical protein n=1 Tax=Kamptonema formosum TaxID=331992 RepID=UPI000346513D|nr:hypothetical protein [Oscillatoria sp. PCC 10802]